MRDDDASRSTDDGALAGVSFVVPSYNGRDLLAETLRRLVAAAPESEVIIVDGGSTDGSPELVERDFPSVRLVREANFGFAHAINRGIERSTRPIVAFTNSDLLVRRRALVALVERLRAAPEVGVIAPMLHLPSGARQRLWGVLGPVLYPPQARLARGAVGVPIVSAAFLMVRRSVLEELGGLDENFFFYNEEWDFCRRLRLAGHRIELLRDQRVTHVAGGSTPRKPEFVLEQLRGFLYYLHKHHGGATAEAARLGMALQGRVLALLDPRPSHAAVWRKLGAIARERRYLESPFPLSGRGVPRFPPIDPNERTNAPGGRAPVP